jgi:hypothetical protein
MNLYLHTIYLREYLHIYGNVYISNSENVYPT